LKDEIEKKINKNAKEKKLKKIRTKMKKKI
jgi:hypothetical protein